MVLSIGIFFSLMIAGLTARLPSAMETGLTAHAVPAATAHGIAQLPAVAVLFAAFLGVNPVQHLLGPAIANVPPDQAAFLTGRGFFPSLITEPFADGLHVAFWFAIIACLVAAVASLLSGRAKPEEAPDAGAETVGAQLAGVAGEAGTIPSELVDAPAVTGTPRP
jgi:hypothetical protein